MFQRYQKQNVLQCILGTAEQFFMVALMYQISGITDEVAAGNADGYAQRMPLLGVTLLLELLFFYAVRQVAIQTRVSCGADLRDRIYQRILYGRAGEAQEKADILNAYNSQIDQLSAMASQSGEKGVAILTLLVAGFYMCTVNLKLLIASMIFVPLSGHVYERLMTPLQRKNRDMMQEKNEINQIVKENLDGFYIVRAFGLSQFFSQKFEQSSENIRNIEREKDKLSSVLGRVGILLRYLPQLVIPLYGGWLTYTGEMTLGELVAANTVIWYVILPIETLLNIRKQRKEQKPMLEEIEWLLNLPREQEMSTQTEKEDLKELKIENLAFAYEDGKEVWKRLDLTIEKGRHVLLLGESGIGKSTLAKILCGLETGYQGTIKINGKTVEKEDVGILREKVVYVPQNPYLFAGSIRDNICMGRSVTSERLEQVMELSGVAQFVRKFPERAETLIGEGGILLSGGQRKRIAIARAMLAEGECYVLDEPMASLDEAGGVKLMQNLARFWADKAMLIISHTTKGLPKVDAVYTVQKGMLNNE